MPALENLHRNASSAQEYAEGFRDRVAAAVQAMDTGGAVRLIEALTETLDADGTVFVLGNGGSGAVAAHWVNDLGVNCLVDGHPGYRVISLGDNASAITAVANDTDFAEVFVAQLRSGLRSNDLVIALSVSGNSPNVIRAVEFANAVGVTTIGFTGMDGGELKELASISIHAPSDTDEYGPVEDIFSVFMHLATGYITMGRGKPLYH